MYKYLSFIFLLLIYKASAQDSPFLVKPYLQIGSKPSTTTMQVLWHTPDTDAEWVVELKNANEKQWRKAEAPTQRKVAASNIPTRRVYNATLTQLLAGQAFQYRVLKAGKSVFETTGKAPKASDQPYRFIVFGDVGAGTPGQRSAAYQSYLTKPDFVAITGDIVYDRGLISEYDTRFWPVYNADKADTAGVPMMGSTPFIGAPGNHDTDTRDLDKFPDALAYYSFWNQPLNGPKMPEGSAAVPTLIASEVNRKAFLEGAGNNYPQMTNFSFDYGNAHWLVLDSNPYMDWTNKELLDWVTNDLEASKSATWHFVMFHHPGFNSSREHYEQQQMRALSEAFEKGGVDIVFNGHVHNYQRTFPMTFKADNKGTLLVGGKDGKIVRGRVINGEWKLDKSFALNQTKPKGIIYLISGAGGQDLYNPEQTNDHDSWQPFTDKYFALDHSISVIEVEGKQLTLRQVSAKGVELDKFVITK